MTKKHTDISPSDHNDLILPLDPNYKVFLAEVKEKVHSSRLQASLAVNQAVIQLYWFIGKGIIEKQKETAWGEKLLETLSRDLNNTFPETYGFSIRNLERMRQFAKEYPTAEITTQAVSQLPWG